MPQPTTLALLLVLLGGTTARAQMAPAHEPSGRTVLIPHNPAEPPPEVRVSQELATVFLFPAPLLKQSVTVDASRIRVLDVGERSLIVQAVDTLGAEERQALEVMFDGEPEPARAAFTLVSRPSGVDTLVRVSRGGPPTSDCETEVRELRARCREWGPEDLVRRGFIDERGVQTASFPRNESTGRGFELDHGLSFRGNGWGMVRLRIQNLAGHPAWTPSGATLTGADGQPMRARVVAAKKGALAPNQAMEVLVVVSEPPPKAGLVFTLEVHGAEGRTFLLTKVPFPARPPQEGAR